MVSQKRAIQLAKKYSRTRISRNHAQQIVDDFLDCQCNDAYTKELKFVAKLLKGNLEVYKRDDQWVRFVLVSQDAIFQVKKFDEIPMVF